MTIGLGPSLFDDRFGLASARPAPRCGRCPPLPGDELDPERSGGDLCVQACADDPQVAFHAVRNLARIGRGTVVMRWSQLGFGRTSTTSRAQATPRNLMGFKDGTNNIKAEDVAALNRHVWVGERGAGVDARRLLPGHAPHPHADRGLGPRLAPGPGADHRPHEDGGRADGRAARARPGRPALERASPPTRTSASPRRTTNGGVRILRRGYSFTDGFDDELGQLDAGLFFIAYQRDPQRQFVALQRRLGANDALNEYIKHTSSAVFAVPPGVRVGDGLDRAGAVRGADLRTLRRSPGTVAPGFVQPYRLPAAERRQ